MIYKLTIPTTIEDNPSLRVLEWHAVPGQVVAADALLVELETHKALIEVRAANAAVLRQRLAEEGEWCALGGTLALLSDDADEPLATSAAEWAADFTIS